MSQSIYLDCNATTPMEPEVRNAIIRYMMDEFGNEGSRTHDYGVRAKQAVQKARDQIARVVGVNREEVIFTSGATEANNLALLGLQEHGERSNKRHIISTQIEHKAVLEPLEELARRGFEVELLPPNSDGWIEADQIRAVLRPDTLLVSVMHANNETGVIQPIADVADVLNEHPAYFHVDAAQTFGKLIEPLQNNRIDLISASAHKVHGPKGVGALVSRRRGFDRIPLAPLVFGGGQERGLRPGTLPVPLIVGFGLAADIALRDHTKRNAVNVATKAALLEALAPLKPKLHCDQSRVLSHVINISIAGVNSEAAMVALKDIVAISNGSACTSASYSLSHVLKAMDLPEEDILGALRISWCHLTPAVDWSQMAARLATLR